MSRITMCRFGINLLAISFVSLFTSASAGEIKIDFCQTCNADSEFIQSGEIAALTTLPLLNEGSQQVLVMNPENESMRMIDVTREQIGSQVGLGGEFWSTTSTIGYLDPDLKTQALEGVRAVKDFLAEIQVEQARDLDFGVVPIDSAADLLGIGDGPDFVRDTFRQALSNRMGDGWLQRVKWQALSFANRMANKFMGETIASASMKVEFDDGTSITVEIAKFFRDDEGNISFELTVLESTATGPGLTVIPSTLAGFLIAFGNGILGDDSYINNLGDLVVRGGGRVNRSSTGGTCDTSMDCVDAGIDENGNPKVECELILPKAELSC